MNILITGSSGMLGQQLCKVLSENGASLTAIDVVAPGEGCPASGKFHIADICDKEGINTLWDLEKPDIAIHTAAWTDVDGCEKDPDKARRLNVEGAGNVSSAAEKHATPLIFISTDFVFDGRKNEPYKEDDECGPLSVYGKTKYEGEKAAMDTVRSLAVVRTSWLYGPCGRNFVDAVISKGLEKEVLRVVDDQVGCPTYTKDLAMAIQGLIEKGISGREIYHVCGLGQCSWYQLALKIKSFIPGMDDVKVEPVSSFEFGRPAPRPTFSVMDTSKFRRCTGKDLRSWEEALYDYVSNR